MHSEPVSSGRLGVDITIRGPSGIPIFWPLTFSMQNHTVPSQGHVHRIWRLDSIAFDLTHAAIHPDVWYHIFCLTRWTRIINQLFKCSRCYLSVRSIFQLVKLLGHKHDVAVLQRKEKKWLGAKWSIMRLLKVS